MKFRITVLMVMALLLTGCLGGSGGSPSATVGLYLAGTGLESTGDFGVQGDAVDFSSIQEVWVDVARIEAKRDGSWEVMAKFSGDDGIVNLMDLRFQAQLLDEFNIPAGRYTEFRFVLNESSGIANVVVLVDGTEVALKVPSSTIKVKDVDLLIEAGSVVELVFDIDLNQFVRRGESGKGFIINPAQTIHLVDKGDFGSLYVKIELPEKLQEELAEVMADLTIGFKVNRVGETTPITEVVFDNGVLELFLEALLPGHYEVSGFIRWKDFELKLEAQTVEIMPSLLRVESLR